MKKNQITSLVLLFFIASLLIISCKKDSAGSNSSNTNCTFTYSAWSTCANGTQTRTFTSSPSGCTGTPNPDSLTRTCTNCPTISVTSNVVNVSCSSTDGSITISASGGVAPYTYNKNGGTFQISNVFTNLSVGTFTIVAKDANGCSSAAQSITVGTFAGPKFTQVRAIIRANCASGCHLNGSNDGQTNFDSDCSIVSKSARINTRCVTQGTMPPSAPLNQTLKDQITAWVNAGGRFTD